MKKGKFMKKLAKELAKNGVCVNMVNSEASQPTFIQNTTTEIIDEDVQQNESYLKKKSQEVVQNDIALENWCRRLERVEKRIDKVEKYISHVNEKVSHMKQKIALIFDLIRQMGYSAGVVDRCMSNKDMLIAWKRHAKKQMKKQNSQIPMIKQWKGGDKS